MGRSRHVAHAPDVAGAADLERQHGRLRPGSTIADGAGCAAISKVLSWLPYSSAFWAISPTFGTVPMVEGSYAPLAMQSSMTAW